MKKWIPILLLFFINLTVSAQLNITNVNNGLQLAQKLLGTGVTISNVTFAAANGSCGFFNSISSPVPLDSGIVLTSGYVKTGVPLTTTVGVNGLATQDAANNNFLGGDAALTTLIGAPTFNASVLEFDFVPLGDTISFNYVFSSDEYPDYNCTDFNDVFAFFISGPGIIGKKNMALIPGTTIPVAINSINDGTFDPQNGGAGATCTGMGAGSPFTGLYINNMTGTRLTHNGLTRKLRAFAVVIPCQTYHLKIAIADAVDQTLDSGVFIEANSLNSNAANCSIQGNFDPVTNSYYLAEGCVGGTVVFTKPFPSTSAQTINLVINGTATNGVDASLIPAVITFPPNQTSVSVPITAFSDAIAEGTENLNIFITSACGSGIFLDSAKIEIRDYEKLFINPDTAFICSGGSQQLIASSGYTSYSWLPNPTLSNTGIANPIATPTGSPSTYYCTAVLGTCQARDSATLLYKFLKLKSKTDINCKNGNTGSISVSTSEGWIAPLQFTINGGAPQNDSIFANLTTGNYIIQITDALNCSATLNVSLIQAFPDLAFTEIITPPVCAVAGSVVVTGSGGLPPYQYSLDGITYQSGNSLSLSNTGTIVIYIKDANLCVTTKTVTVVSPTTINFTTNITPATCSGLADGNVLILASNGTPPYQYSVDGGVSFQNSNSIPVTSGVKTIQVKDNAGCISSQLVTIPFINSLVVSAGLPVSICQGLSTTLSGSSNGTTNSWLPNSFIVNGSSLTPTVTPPLSTWYYLTTTQGPCVKTDSVYITVRPAPFANAGNDTSICYGNSVFLNGSGGVQFDWKPALNMQFPATANPLVTPLNTISYGLMVKDVFGCTSLTADSVTIKIIPKILVNAGKDTLVALNQPIQLNGITNAGNLSWSPATYLSNPNIGNPIATFPILGDWTYYLTAQTTEGCFNKDTLHIKIYNGPEIYVPTAFTPNADGVNDVLKITAVGLKQFNYYRIFNRWGQLVFQTTNPEIGWNGFFNQKAQTGGAYVWMVEGVDYRNNLIRKKGTLMLIR